MVISLASKVVRWNWGVILGSSVSLTGLSCLTILDFCFPAS